jgi:hypothetical protein
MDLENVKELFFELTAVVLREASRCLLPCRIGMATSLSLVTVLTILSFAISPQLRSSLSCAGARYPRGTLGRHRHERRVRRAGLRAARAVETIDL